MLYMFLITICTLLLLTLYNSPYECQVIGNDKFNKLYELLKIIHRLIESE